MVVLLLYSYCYHFIDDFAHIYTYAAAVAGSPSNTLQIAIISIFVGGFIFLIGLGAGAVCGACYHNQKEVK